MFKMTADGNVDPDDIVAIKAYLIWMTLSGELKHGSSNVLIPASIFFKNLNHNPIFNSK